MLERRQARGRLSLGVAALGAALACPLAAAADPSPSPPPPADAPAADAGRRAEKETELRGVEDTIRASDEQRRAIQTEIESVRADHARLTAALIDATAKVQDAERGVAAADERLKSLNEQAQALTQSLDKRRDAIAELLAALQRMGANPPPAIFVKPDDMAEAVRAATVLSGMIPDLKTETDVLARDAETLSETRTQIARERESLTQQRAGLAAEKARLDALVDARHASLEAAEASLGAQQQRAAELARQASSLKDFIARLDAEAARRKAAEDAAKAAQAEAAHQILVKAEDARSQSSARLQPDVAFADIKGRVPLPAAGAILKTFGAPDGLGGTEHGVSLATPAGATVSAPADGSVLYSGPYRSYGQLLIINAGGGYYMLLAGMERVNVSPGEFVLTGEPVGAMGDGSVRMAAAAAIGAAQPVLYIELRKDGTAIDPAPWWSKAGSEKARG
ncbi:MAG: peptidoglycan DD-metalloendopeptidase family protein [Methylobacteriaceae bacterium]|nr:peptidoglycan DD-metalloendopeptidase family protein [Methylobacteriaceae bacterium]